MGWKEYEHTHTHTHYTDLTVASFIKSLWKDAILFLISLLKVKQVCILSI